MTLLALGCCALVLLLLASGGIISVGAAKIALNKRLFLLGALLDLG